MKYILLFTLLTFVTSADSQSTDTQKQAQKIVDKAIKTHGGKKYNDAHFSYVFRKHNYTFHYDKGAYIYQRYNSANDTKDVLTNEGLKRYVAGKEQKLSSKEYKTHSSSVNSVHYFAFLPFFLNDAAVHKDLVGEATIKGKLYYKIQVTFDEEGGGQDHDDMYIYWINKKSHSVDYLAYSFHVNGGGVRFRSSYNRRSIGGIVFQDYINYKHDKNTSVAVLDSLYEADKLTELSRIELVNIEQISR